MNRASSAIFAHAAEQWAVMRDEYAAYLEAHVAAATAATNGVLLNRRGRSAGIDSWRLFTASPTFAAAYASRELADYWTTHPRLTLAEFEAAWLTTNHGDEADGIGTEIAGSKLAELPAAA